MRVNARALFSVAGIKAVRKDPRSDACWNASIGVVTPQSLSATQALMASSAEFGASERDPDVELGDVVALYRAEPDVVRGEIFRAHTSGKEDRGIPLEDLYMVCPAPEAVPIRFLGDEMLRAREVMLRAQREGAVVGVSERNAVQTIDELFRMAVSRQSGPQMPSEVVRMAHAASAVDRYGDVELGVSFEEFGRKLAADAVRSAIGKLEPEHADALVDTRGVDRLLSAAGIEKRALAGGSVRAGVGAMLADEDLRRVAASNERLCREVFGAVTSTPIERLAVGLLTLEEHGRIQQSLESCRLSGEWTEEVQRRVREITSGSVAGYDFEMAVYSRNGQDLLLVRELQGPLHQAGVGYFYGWNSADRRRSIDVSSRAVATISPEEIPAAREVDRLCRIYSDVSQGAAAGYPEMPAEGAYALAYDLEE